MGGAKVVLQWLSDLVFRQQERSRAVLLLLDWVSESSSQDHPLLCTRTSRNPGCVTQRLDSTSGVPPW